MKPSDIEKGLSADRLREVLRYEPETGKFFWLKGNNQKKAGDEAGWAETKTRYIRITIFGQRYLAHRLAWLYVTGEWPHDRIDHKNMGRPDNRWENLRQASDSQNSANQKTSKKNMLGIKGVRLHECGRYTARICVGRKSMYLGLFYTPDDARDAYAKKAREIFGEFARTK